MRDKEKCNKPAGFKRYSILNTRGNGVIDPEGPENKTKQ